MKKQIFSLSLLMAFISSVSVDAQTVIFSGEKERMAQSWLLVPNSPILQSKNNSAKVSTANFQFIAEKNQESFKDGISDNRLSQLLYDKKEKEITLSTVTFDGDYIRTSTLCEGKRIDQGRVDKEIFCATATQKVCDRVLKVYSGQKSQIAAAPTVACVDAMKSYGKVLQAFADASEGNSGMAGKRNQIIDEEDAAASKMLKQMTDGTLYRSNFINHFSAARAMKTAEDLSSSLQGIQQMANFVDLCKRSQLSFNPKNSESAQTSGQGPRANTKKAQ